MKVNEVERGSYPKPKLDYVPDALPALRRRSLHRRSRPTARCTAVADGIVIIDPQKAKGQKAIVNSCPYRMVYWNAELELPQKCTLCAHHLDKGEKTPRCVEACPTGALVFGDLDDPTSEIAQLTASLDVEVYHPEYDTAPLVKYVGLPKRFIVGEVVVRDDQGECAEGVRSACSRTARRSMETEHRQLRRLRVRRPREGQGLQRAGRARRLLPDDHRGGHQEGRRPGPDRPGAVLLRQPTESPHRGSQRSHRNRSEVESRWKRSS